MDTATTLDFAAAPAIDDLALHLSVILLADLLDTERDINTRTERLGEFLEQFATTTLKTYITKGIRVAATMEPPPAEMLPGIIQRQVFRRANAMYRNYLKLTHEFEEHQ